MKTNETQTEELFEADELPKTPQDMERLIDRLHQDQQEDEY